MTITSSNELRTDDAIGYQISRFRELCVCSLLVAKPVPKPMANYYHLDFKEHISLTFNLKF